MSSPEDKFPSQKSHRQSKNGFLDLPTFMDSAFKPPDWDPAISMNEEEIHLTPANLAPTHYKMQSTNVSRGSRGSISNLVDSKNL